MHVRINGDVPRLDFIERVERVLHAATARTELRAGCATGVGARLLHFDLSESLTARANALLFELLFLGSVVDAASGRAFVWDGGSGETAVAVELASGRLVTRLPICAALPTQAATAGAASFVASAEGLAAGMGPAFTSVVFDGTCAGGSKGGAPATAYERLCYVCTALKIHDEGGGAFPHNFDAELAALRAAGPIPAEESFALLQRSAELGARPSLWCLWNFVNIVYWQLRDMHHADSPLNAACMPDSKARPLPSPLPGSS